LTAAILCLGFTGLNLVGIRKSAGVNNVLVGIKLAVLTFFIAFGALHFNSDNFIPFVPLSSGVLYGAFFIFFAYGGFARVAVVAEEVKDAKRNVPKAMLISLGISITVYFLVGFVALGLLGSVGLADSASPLSSAAGVTGNSFAIQIVAVGGLVATASVLLTAILGVSRMAYSMARRNDLPSALARLHSRFLTPYYAILASGLLMTVLVLFFDLTRVVAISTFALLFYYSIINIAAFKLNTNHKMNRVMPVLGLVSLILLLVFVFLASTDSWIIGVVFLVVGTVYYKVFKKLRHKVVKAF
jgi:APA family basic amino acid/polyamine antiporter